MTDIRRILVIDDSMTVRKLVEIALRGTPHIVQFAATGSEGLSLARDKRPDVILLDNLLPDLKGPEVCQRLGQDGGTSAVPIVVMSANSHRLMGDYRQFPTVVDFVGKPFTADGIRARLDRAAQHPGMGSAARPDALAGGSSATPPGPAPATGLDLRGDAATTPMRDVLRLLGACKATGSLAVDHGAHTVIWFRRGEILLATSTDELVPPEMPAEMRTTALRDLQTGKPLVITLAEAGLRPVTTLPLELVAASKRAVAELFGLSRGAFAWTALVSVPDHVEAFGRAMSLASIDLAATRETVALEEAMKLLALSFDRTAKFSQKLAGARLDADERKVLALVDGRSGHELVTKSRLPPLQVASILERLRAADLIVHDLQSSLAVRTLAICIESDPTFVADLRAAFRRHAGAVQIVEIARDGALGAAIGRTRADLVLVESALLSPEVCARELASAQRDGGSPVVALLPGPMTPADAWLQDAGLHGVMCQPLHVSELVRLVFL